MKILALRMFNVRRFAGRGVAIEGIGDGVNVLCAANEFGKSTSFEALHALFFQPHSSVGAEVKNLRPYSGGNPLVEADIASGQSSYRITKQFHGARSARVVDLATGRLVAQADEAETFVADLVRGGTAGPAGLLWVRQGVTGIERRSRTEEESEKQVRASLLESVQGEVEAVTGGRRMAAVMAKVEEELSRHVTATGRARTGERYAAAIDERGRREAEEKRLWEEVTLLRAALDRRAAASGRLAELERHGDREERRQAIDAAQAAVDGARSETEALRAAEAELRLSTERRDGAKREFDAYLDALERASVLDAKLDEAERSRSKARANRDAAAANLARARADSDAAEAAEQEARTLLGRLDAALKARQAGERVAELDARLQTAEGLRAAIEQDEAALTLLRVPDRTAAELETLEVEIAGLRAVAEAARPSVAIAYETGAPSVALDGVPLQEGEPRTFADRAELTIPGIGVVTLRAREARDGELRLRQGEERRRELLVSLGVDDLAAVRARQAAARRAEGDLHERRARLSVLAPDGLPALRAEIATWRSTGDGVLELKADPAEIRAAHSSAEAALAEARVARRAAEPLHSVAADALSAAQDAFARLDAERAQLDAILGPRDARSDRAAQMRRRLGELETLAAERRAALDALRARGADLTAAEAKLARLRSVSDATEREIAALREDIAALGAEIRARSEDAVEEKWRETVEAHAAARGRVAAYEREIAVLQRLRSALETARGRARDTYLRPVMAELQPLLALLFDDVSITFDERTLLPRRILRNGQEEEVERLSGGMREQLSVLTRLAFARLLARDGRPAPVILDDALVYSDDDRIEKMFNALHRQARDQQIIVFSCRQRAFRELGGTPLRMTDWMP